MRVSSAVNRAKLVDEPIVEMLLSRKFYKSGLKFMKADLKSDFEGTDIICYSDGFKRNLNVKRNSSRYFDSPNFTLTINKEKVDTYKNTQFVFIDEVADCLYMIAGENLYKYILEKESKLRETGKENTFFLVIPKKDLVALVNSDDDIIKYNKAVANLFATCRDESIYENLT